MNRLLLHADDFGLNDAVTRGIVEGLSSGLLTGSSVLANAPSAPQAIDLWKRLEQQRIRGELPSAPIRNRLGDADAPFDLGVHLNLTQGRPLTGPRYPDVLLDARGRFLSPGRLFLRLVRDGHRWQRAVHDELAAQIEWLFDQGLRPTHLNGHQYVEMMPVVCQLIPSLALRYGIGSVRAACEPRHWRTSLRPGLRLANCGLASIKQFYALRFRRMLDAAGLRHTDAYFGASHAGRIDLPLMRCFLNSHARLPGAHPRRLSLRERTSFRGAKGDRDVARRYPVSEIAFHPGRTPTLAEEKVSEDGWHDPLALARPRELELLGSPEFAKLLLTAGFRLGRFNQSSAPQSQAA